MAKQITKISPSEVQQYLGDADYPATKDELIRNAEDNNAPSEIIDVLEELDEEEYGSPADVIRAYSEFEMDEREE